MLSDKKVENHVLHLLYFGDNFEIFIKITLEIHIKRQKVLSETYFRFARDYAVVTKNDARKTNLSNGSISGKIWSENPKIFLIKKTVKRNSYDQLCVSLPKILGWNGIWGFKFNISTFFMTSRLLFRFLSDEYFSGYSGDTIYLLNVLHTQLTFGDTRCQIIVFIY